jgi:hypothetical protein
VSRLLFPRYDSDLHPFQIMIRRLNLKLLLGIYLLIGWHLPAKAHTGGWTHQSFFDQRTQAWWVQVSSTVPRVLTVTITWHGNSGIGTRVRGRFVMVVPAYPGFGAATTAEKGVPGVRNFGYTIVSN